MMTNYEKYGENMEKWRKEGAREMTSLERSMHDSKRPSGFRALLEDGYLVKKV